MAEAVGEGPPDWRIVKRRAKSRCQDSPMAPAIVVSGLVKNFGTTRALNGLDLKVETGEVYGFLGPNGAGASRFSAVIHGATRWRCTAVSRTYPAR